MARYSGKKRVSSSTREEAMKIARGTQRPGQTKEQTKLIAQGIERGIDLYKREQKEKSREADKRRRQEQRQASRAGESDGAPGATAGADDEKGRAGTGPAGAARAWLPWTLLVLTWAGLGAYFWLLRT